jgi:hypothetical protein
MNKRYQLASDVFFDENIEGIFILSGAGEVYVLEDDVSKTVWNYIVESPRTIEEIQIEIRNRFEITPDDPVDEDIQDFISAMEKIGVVEGCTSLTGMTS